MSRRIVLWLDDWRDPSTHSFRTYVEDRLPEDEDYFGVYWAKTPEEFKKLFVEIVEDPEREVYAAFFDNNLGHGLEKAGPEVFAWMDRYVRDNGVPAFLLRAQTAHPGARRKLHASFQELYRYWEGDDATDL